MPEAEARSYYGQPALTGLSPGTRCPAVVAGTGGVCATALERSVLRIRTFGGLTVHRGDERVMGAAAQPRRMALLAMVARAGERGVSRERLLSILWPDADAESGRHALKQALYALRRDADIGDLFIGTRELRLDSEAVHSDVGEFQDLRRRGLHEKAVGVCDGLFLAGFRLSSVPEFEYWMEEEREVLQRDLADSLEHLARAARGTGDSLAALRWTRRLAALDPLNARLTIDLMTALLAAGDRAGALQQARIYESLIAQELDLPPDPNVAALARQIREGTVLPAPIPAAAPAVTTGTQRERADELYRQGSRAWTPQSAGLGEGLDFFRQAIAIDPAHARAHAALAEAYTQLAFYGFLPAPRAAALVDAAAREAMRLDPGIAESHLACGTSLLWVHREFAAGIAELETALRIDPSLVVAQARLAFVRLCHDGPLDAGRAGAERAAHVAGATGLSRVMFGQQFLAAGRYDDAIAALQAAIDIEAPNFLAYHWLVAAYVQKRQGADAVAAAVAEASISGRHPWSLMSLVVATAAAGQVSRARTLLDTLVARAAGGYVQASVLAQAHAALGEVETGFQCLERAAEERDPSLMMLRTFPMFAAFRHHPRYPSLLRQVGWKD